MNDDEEDMKLNEERALMIERVGNALDAERAAIRAQLAPSESKAREALALGNSHEAAALYAEIARTWREAGFHYLANQYHQLSSATLRPRRSSTRRSA
jgi:hypothetical protein